MAESEVKSAALWLGKLLVDEINCMGGVRDMVEELQSELNTLAAFLIEGVKSHRQDQVVRAVVTDARNVAYDCQDVIETYMLEVARDGYEEYEGFQLGSVMRWTCLVWKAPYVYRIRSRIDDLNKRISALKSRMISFGVPYRINEQTHHQTEPVMRRVYFHEREEYAMVGLEDHLDELVARLTNPNDQTVIAICGMGGIGKSTLARELYHHPKLSDGGHFQSFGWCHVSRQFQANSVLQDLMYSLVSENDHERRREILESVNANRAHATLYKMLKDEKCFVVIDDIWTANDWARLQAAFPRKKAIGSRILLTTRNEETVSSLDTNKLYLHPITGLDGMKSWDLFEIIAFSDFRKEELGRDMLRHCNGVPLAIVVLGEVLRRKEKVEQWKQMWNNIVAQIKRGGAPTAPYKEVFDVLQVSYDELPYYLKHCFLHLANFPEDFEIPVGKLIHLWVAEGIILNEGPNESEEDVANRYLNELVSRNMVHVASRHGGTGRIETFRLHDLMRDICIEIAKREGFLQIINSQSSVFTNYRNADHLLMTWLPKRDKMLRRLAVYNVRDSQIASFPTSDMPTSAKVSRAPNLRSLMLFSVYTKPTKGHCHKFVGTIAKYFPLLRVLDCRNFRIGGKLPKQVGNFIHLRYLCLLNTPVTELPSSIEKLQWLQTLDLRVNVNVVLSLPNILWKMKQLRHLYLPFYGGLELEEKQRVGNNLQRYVIQGGGMLRLDGRKLHTLIFIDLDRVELQGILQLERMDTSYVSCETNKEALYPFLQSSSMKSLMLRVHARVINDDSLILSTSEVMHYMLSQTLTFL